MAGLSSATNTFTERTTGAGKDDFLFSLLRAAAWLKKRNPNVAYLDVAVPASLTGQLAQGATRFLHSTRPDWANQGASFAHDCAKGAGLPSFLRRSLLRPETGTSRNDCCTVALEFFTIISAQKSII
ncbi:MAG: hypothetical protein HYX72_04900 [Acidobacteria bacterium]|nr:hypothetical protein [Acidobacteriota bacterium]